VNRFSLVSSSADSVALDPRRLSTGGGASSGVRQTSFRSHWKGARLRGQAHCEPKVLAIEVDISPSEVDRPGIYAALRVAAVWRFDTTGLTVDRLSEDGTSVEVEASGFLDQKTSAVVRPVATWIPTIARS
jgi:hypothetical protein